jgi:two-component system OmpR family response regulator
MRILIIEDDVDAAAAMAKGLQDAGHESQHAEDGLAGLTAARDGQFDVLVVDRMMPKLNGVQVVETLGEVGDRVDGLKAGADDYLVKPYAFAELIARVEALSRRRETGSVSTILKVGDLEMDLIGRNVHRAGTEIDLQPREFQLLEFLMRHANQSVTRTMLLEKVWEYHFDPQTNVIDVHISRLRAKIDKGFPRAMLQTVRGAGYRLEA